MYTHQIVIPLPSISQSNLHQAGVDVGWRVLKVSGQDCSQKSSGRDSGEGMGERVCYDNVL